MFLNPKITELKDGIVTLQQLCWCCGNIMTLTIPLDDVGTEKVEATMCEDCIDNLIINN